MADCTSATWTSPGRPTCCRSRWTSRRRRRRLLGDVVVVPAGRRARTTPSDPAGELRLLLVHGILHLLGYDHEDGRRARRDVGAAGAVQRGAVP